MQTHTHVDMKEQRQSGHLTQTPKMSLKAIVDT